MRISDWSSDVCSSDLEAFDNDYPGLKSLSEHELFLWAGKLVLGLIYREFEMAAAAQAPGTPLDVAPSLLAKLGNLQLLMQSLFRPVERSEEHSSELQYLMRISYAVFCLKKKNRNTYIHES